MPPSLPIIQSPLHAVFFCIALLLATAAWAIVPEHTVKNCAGKVA